jgi:hypothetical protein
MAKQASLTRAAAGDTEMDRARRSFPAPPKRIANAAGGSCVPYASYPGMIGGDMEREA